MAIIVLDEVTMKACRCLTREDVLKFFNSLEEPKKERAPAANFRHLIQYPEPERLLQRLHALIDGRRGAAVGCVLLKCVQLNYLVKNPTQAEFCSEFQLTGSWQSIHKYMDENNLNALAKANRVVIF